MILWSSKYSVGHTGIDEQHKQFIRMLNQLKKIEAAGGPIGDLRVMLMGLLTYAEVHFSYEEGLMRDTGYPFSAEHDISHKAAFSRINQMMRHDADELDLYRLIHNFMRAWLTHHILGEDKRFGEWLRNNAYDIAIRIAAKP